MAKRGQLIVISGPSGTGKGTLIRELRKRRDVDLSISCTTRAPRAGEQHGREYYFISDEAFDEMLERNAFLEHADVFGRRYGTPRDRVMQILDSGRDVILEIDVQGALQVKENYPQARLVFILPPSEEELLRRLSGRGTETAEQVQRRFSEAKKEMSVADRYDHRIVNADVDTAVTELGNLLDEYAQD